MTDHEIKVLISEHLKTMQDQGFATVLRFTLFGSNNIDWQSVWVLVRSFMPEYEESE